jgi:hypothetical protein
MRQLIKGNVTSLTLSLTQKKALFSWETNVYIAKIIEF